MSNYKFDIGINIKLLDAYWKANCNDPEGQLLMAVVCNALEIRSKDPGTTILGAIEKACRRACIGYYDSRKDESFPGLPPDKLDVAIQTIWSVLAGPVGDMYE
ncbi:MAG: hypothetical protein ACFFCW_14330 [Candidatus Hodarchaeota archaeon]